MKKLLLALITSVLPNLVFAQTQCGQCHSTAVPLSSGHPNGLRRIVPNATQTTEKEFSKRFMKATKVKFPAIPATSLTKIPWFYAN